MKKISILGLLLWTLASSAAPLKIGWDITDVSSDKPLVQYGRPKRYVSRGLRDPLAVTTLVIDAGSDCVIFTTWDVCVVWWTMVHRVRSIVHDRWSADGRRGGRLLYELKGEPEPKAPTALK